MGPKLCEILRQKTLKLTVDAKPCPNMMRILGYEKPKKNNIVSSLCVGYPWRKNTFEGVWVFSYLFWIKTHIYAHTFSIHICIFHWINIRWCCPLRDLEGMHVITLHYCKCKTPLGSFATADRMAWHSITQRDYTNVLSLMIVDWSHLTTKQATPVWHRSVRPMSSCTL